MSDINPRDWLFLSNTPLTPRQRGILPPTVGILDAPASCVTINREWVSHIIGILEVLTQRSAWLGDDETVDTAIQEIEQLIHALIVESCEPTIMDIRVHGGYLQKTFDGEIWLNVEQWEQIHTVESLTLPPGEDATVTLIDGVLTLGIPRGAQGATGPTGAQGIQGVQGVPGTNGTPGAAGADADGMPIGSVIAYPVSVSVPAGWLVCNGQLVEGSEYPDLFALIGTMYGGIGSAFRTPDYSDRFLLGNPSGGTVGATGGAHTKNILTGNLPVHAHSIPDHTHSIPDHQHTVAKRNNSAAGNNNYFLAGNATGTADTLNTSSAGAGDTGSAGAGNTGNAGSGTAFDVRPAYRQVVWLIKALDNAAALNVEFDMDGCDLKWRKDGGSWVTLVDLSECTTPGAQGEQGETGATGAQGIQGVQGLPGDCPECIESPEPDDSEDERICGMAVALVNWMWDEYEIALGAIDDFGSLTAVVRNLSDLLYPVGYIPQSISTIVGGAITVGTSVARQGKTNENKTEITRRLYCLLKLYPFSYSTLNTWMEDVHDSFFAPANAWVVSVATWWTGWDIQRSKQIAYIGSLEPQSDCVFYDCGCAGTIDFDEPDDFEWSLVEGTIGVGLGVTGDCALGASYDAGEGRRVTLSVDFEEPCDLHNVAVMWRIEHGNPNGAAGLELKAYDAADVLIDTTAETQNGAREVYRAFSKAFVVAAVSRLEIIASFTTETSGTRSLRLDDIVIS